MTSQSEAWDRNEAWHQLKPMVVEDHGPLFWGLLRFINFLRVFPSPGELPFWLWRYSKHDARRHKQKCTRTGWSNRPCTVDLADFKAASPGTHKLNLGQLDWGQAFNVFIAIGLCLVFAYFLNSIPVTSQWLWIVWMLMIYRLATIAVDAVAMLWFDDLIDLYFRKDPRVQSFRRLSVHVVLQMFEVVLLFACLYVLTSAAKPFRYFLFLSFQSALTLNYENGIGLNRKVWIAEVTISILLLVLVLAVAAGEKHVREEVARNPGKGWSETRPMNPPFKESPLITADDTKDPEYLCGVS
jgi:hypothetical protein